MKTWAGLLSAVIIFTFAVLLHGLVCMRYIDRASDDRGVIIFLFVVLVFYAVTAVYLYSKWIKERGKETEACSGKK